LAKSRLLINLARRNEAFLPILLIIVLDLLLSMGISSLFVSLGLLLRELWIAPNLLHLWFLPHLITHALQDWGPRPFLGLLGGDNSFFTLFTLTTALTSVWMLLILVSLVAIKLLAPLHRFTAWFFDVDKHPVQAIGIVAGALVMLGSLVSTVVRVLI
jgi:hypothetical protein